ncbi:hypothetical protein CDEST_10319 [Colletotrichum destructivum]|uniref:Uncharacterized protein n=1 Tax=Colletotrichum destructivum TaxID=34406 RepID=A0AAX4IQC8_9PEZI|nr:hypothetical protein CDEST_10319 [Colletotrichum destructivum]
MARLSEHLFFSHLLLFLATSLGWLLAMLITSTPALPPTERTTPLAKSPGLNVTSTRRQLTCGNSTEEAVALGCKFDASLGGWLAAPCYDQAWVDDYLSDGSGTAYADKNLTQRMTHSEVLERGVYWSSFRDHINHCVAGWRRQSQAFFEDRPALDSSIISVTHVSHCAQLLMDAALGTQRRDPTENVTGYFECWVRD